jgi:hypothetical protein
MEDWGAFAAAADDSKGGCRHSLLFGFPYGHTLSIHAPEAASVDDIHGFRLEMASRLTFEAPLLQSYPDLCGTVTIRNHVAEKFPDKGSRP